MGTVVMSQKGFRAQVTYSCLQPGPPLGNPFSLALIAHWPTQKPAHLPPECQLFSSS